MASKTHFEITYQMPEGETPHIWGMETTNKIGNWARDLLAEHGLNMDEYILTAYANDETMTIRATLERRDGGTS